MSVLKRNKLLRDGTAWAICLLLFTPLVFAQAKVHVYSTWDTLEVDTCATAWLIKNFIDKNAVFKFYPKGEIVAEGIAFDTPDAEFRRTASFSAYETVLNKYKLEDPALKKIGTIIHEIEINYWSQDSKSKILEFKQRVLFDVQTASTPDEGLEKAFLVFDGLYQDLSAK